MSNLITLEVTTIHGVKKTVYVPGPIFWKQFARLWRLPSTAFVEVVR